MTRARVHGAVWGHAGKPGRHRKVGRMCRPALAQMGGGDGDKTHTAYFASRVCKLLCGPHLYRAAAYCAEGANTIRRRQLLFLMFNVAVSPSSYKCVACILLWVCTVVGQLFLRFSFSSAWCAHLGAIQGVHHPVVLEFLWCSINKDICLPLSQHSRGV